MRRPTRGVFGMDIALSISHNHSTGLTCALLLGCSDSQAIFILHQLTRLASLISHPLLLPTIISDNIWTLLDARTAMLWNDLFSLEGETGQGIIKAIPSPPTFPPTQHKDYGAVTKDALGIVQLSLAWENYVKALLCGIESIQKSIQHFELNAPSPRRNYIATTAAVLDERLSFLHHSGTATLQSLQFMQQRTHAQINAVGSSSKQSYNSKSQLMGRKQVYNYIAQTDNHLNQELAADSREIAAASKRDSSAMKALAVLTMFFLPGTFISVCSPFFPPKADKGVYTDC